eukprot:1160482-Pelagomonas_calceolata.AAC.13
MNEHLATHALLSADQAPWLSLQGPKGASTHTCAMRARTQTHTTHKASSTCSEQAVINGVSCGSAQR